MALAASIGSLVLVSVFAVTCVGCMKSLAMKNRKAIEAKKSDVESQPKKFKLFTMKKSTVGDCVDSSDVAQKMPASNSQENNSELYSAITDSQMSTKASVMVNRDINLKENEESPYELPVDIEAFFASDRGNLYTKIEKKRREHDDIKMIDADSESTYNGRPEVPSKNFDYVKASRTFGADEDASQYASYYGVKSTAGSNHYELGSNLSSSHYDVLPEYETISQMVLMQQKQSGGKFLVDEETITLNEQEEDVYYSNLNQNETICTATNNRNGLANDTYASTISNVNDNNNNSSSNGNSNQQAINFTIHKL